MLDIMPFRPGKGARFVLTPGPKEDIEFCVREFQKYIDVEIGRYNYNDDPANQKLVEIQGAMKILLEVGLDGLTPDERKAIDGFDETMRTPYRRDGEKKLIEHMQNWNGTYDINMRYIHEGMDALGVMIGKPATYEGNRAERLKNRRAKNR